MLKIFQRKDLMMRIFLGFVMGMIGLAMLTYLVPGQGGTASELPDIVADVEGQAISRVDVQRMMSRLAGRQTIPRALEALYARQVVDQLIFERLLELEAQRLGIRVTEEEQSERIKRLVPSVFAGETFVGRERYETEVYGRFEMSVPEFEEIIRKSLLEGKFRRLVTDGISVSPEEVELEFRKRNEKVRLEYVVVKPGELEARVPVSDADLTLFFEKKKERYQVPERRSIRYALLDQAQLRESVPVSDDELRAYYNQHIDRYRVQNRTRVNHILFKTVGKSDAEVEEIRRKAEDVLKKARSRAKFEDLAKQHSEDTTKDAGGDLGWIVQGQTVAEFEKVAFSQPVGTISDVVKTQYGFHIIRVAERQNARTQSFEEVRAAIFPIVSGEKAQEATSGRAEQIADSIRRSSRRPIQELAKEFKLQVVEAPPVGVNEPVGALGVSPQLHEAIFRLRPGELSSPVRLERGIVVLALKEVIPSHQGTFAEVRSRVEADFRREKAIQLARARAEELARRAGSAEGLTKAAKALSFEVKTSELFARNGSVPELGAARQVSAAFTMTPGSTSPATFLSSNWVVYRVLAREEAKPEELDKQRKDIEQQLFRSKASLAYDAFRSALRERMTREGKLRLNEANYKRLTNPT